MWKGIGNGARIALAVGVIGIAEQVTAAPVMLNSSQFTTAIAPLDAAVEDFEGFTPGPYYPPAATPLQLANSTFLASAPIIYSANDWEPFLATQTLGNDGPDVGPVTGRVFKNFSSGTTVFGLDMWGAADELLDVKVEGNSGSLHVEQPFGSFDGGTGDGRPHVFVGFEDDLGLLSVTFQNHGIGTGVSWYAMDNVRTGSVVPEPTTILLLGSGLIGLAGYSRRRAKK